MTKRYHSNIIVRVRINRSWVLTNKLKTRKVIQGKTAVSMPYWMITGTGSGYTQITHCTVFIKKLFCWVCSFFRKLNTQSLSVLHLRDIVIKLDQLFLLHFDNLASLCVLLGLILCFLLCFFIRETCSSSCFLILWMYVICAPPSLSCAFIGVVAVLLRLLCCAVHAMAH
jgi:hypothetical protein